MTKFADQLFDDLMREHGPSLADVRAPSAPKRRVAHPVRLGAVAGGVAAAAVTAGLVLAGGASPAYAVTSNADGTVSVAVYDQSGFAGANAALQKLGHRIALVPVKAGCESVTALPLVSRADGYRLGRLSISKSGGSVVVLGGLGGPWTISGQDVPRGDVDLVLVQETSKGMELWSHVLQWRPVTVKGRPGYAGFGSLVTLTRAPAPSCVSVPVFKG